jgi:hypothetical protein
MFPFPPSSLGGTDVPMERHCVATDNHEFNVLFGEQSQELLEVFLDIQAASPLTSVVSGPLPLRPVHPHLNLESSQSPFLQDQTCRRSIPSQLSSVLLVSPHIRVVCSSIINCHSCGFFYLYAFCISKIRNTAYRYLLANFPWLIQLLLSVHFEYQIGTQPPQPGYGTTPEGAFASASSDDFRVYRYCWS